MAIISGSKAKEVNIFNPLMRPVMRRIKDRGPRIERLFKRLEDIVWGLGKPSNLDELWSIANGLLFSGKEIARIVSKANAKLRSNVKLNNPRLIAAELLEALAQDEGNAHFSRSPGNYLFTRDVYPLLIKGETDFDEKCLFLPPFMRSNKSAQS